MYSGEYDACDVTLSVYPHRSPGKLDGPPFVPCGPPYASDRNFLNHVFIDPK
jgi:hypothetical protein